MGAGGKREEVDHNYSFKWAVWQKITARNGQNGILMADASKTTFNLSKIRNKDSLK